MFEFRRSAGLFLCEKFYSKKNNADGRCKFADINFNYETYRLPAEQCNNILYDINTSGLLIQIQKQLRFEF